MVRVAYLDCPQCAEERLYVLYEPPWDENMAGCVTCGHVWGYLKDTRFDYDPVSGTGRTVVYPRPTLDPQVLAAGMAKVREQERQRLLRNLGPDFMEIYHAQRRLKEGLDEQDPARRAALLNSQAPGLRRQE